MKLSFSGSKKKKIIITCIVVILIILIVILSISDQKNKTPGVRDTIINECVSICESFGLEDVEVIFIKYKKYSWADGWSIGIKTSNFSDLSESAMLELDKELSFVDNIFLDYYFSKGDRYDILRAIHNIYKNDELIYDGDPESKTQQNAQSNSSPPSVSTTNLTDDEKGFAVAVAQQEVKDRLKSPSSAKFPWGFDEYSISKSGDVYTVVSYVDADNSYGANLRIAYVVEFEKTGNDSYILKSVNLIE